MRVSLVRDALTPGHLAFPRLAALRLHFVSPDRVCRVEHLRVEIGVSRPRFGPVLIGECGESCVRGRGTHIDRHFRPVSAGNRSKKSERRPKRGRRILVLVRRGPASHVVPGRRRRRGVDTGPRGA